MSLGQGDISHSNYNNKKGHFQKICPQFLMSRLPKLCDFLIKSVSTRVLVSTNLLSTRNIFCLRRFLATPEKIQGGAVSKEVLAVTGAWELSPTRHPPLCSRANLETVNNWLCLCDKIFVKILKLPSLDSFPAECVHVMEGGYKPALVRF